MNISAQLAKHIRDVHFGGNWTSVNLKDTLKDISWQQAITKVHSFNTIATLVFHTNYYVEAITRVLKGQPLIAKDVYSFAHPPITSQEDWDAMLNKTWQEAEEFANLVEQLPDIKLNEVFTDEKYGNYYRNLSGVVEHYHYHLGQIVLIKKILNEQKK